MSGNRYLIVNADDYGRSPGINTGILKAHAEGIVTSTTLMVNLPWSAEAVATTRSWPALAVGLHLNFCYGPPVAAASSVASLLNPEGEFETSIPTLLESALEDEIRYEARAQLERFRTLMGLEPSHIDSHKYLHSNSPFLTVVADIAASEGLPVRAIGAVDRALLRKSGVVTTDRFSGRFHGLDGEGVGPEVLMSVVDELDYGWTELMCHPGLVDEHISDSSYTADRERELAVLCSIEIREKLAAQRVKLTSYLEMGKEY